MTVSSAHPDQPNAAFHLSENHSPQPYSLWQILFRLLMLVSSLQRTSQNPATQCYPPEPLPFISTSSALDMSQQSLDSAVAAPLLARLYVPSGVSLLKGLHFAGKRH